VVSGQGSVVRGQWSGVRGQGSGKNITPHRRRLFLRDRWGVSVSEDLCFPTHAIEENRMDGARCICAQVGCRVPHPFRALCEMGRKPMQQPDHRPGYSGPWSLVPVLKPLSRQQPEPGTASSGCAACAQSCAGRCVPKGRQTLKPRRAPMRAPCGLRGEQSPRPPWECRS